MANRLDWPLMPKLDRKPQENYKCTVKRDDVRV